MHTCWMKVLIFKLQTFEQYCVCTLSFYCVILYFWWINLMCMWHAGCCLLNYIFWCASTTASYTDSLLTSSCSVAVWDDNETAGSEMKLCSCFCWSLAIALALTQSSTWIYLPRLPESTHLKILPHEALVSHLRLFWLELPQLHLHILYFCEEFGRESRRRSSM